MTKVVLKKSEVLKSARPVVIEPLSIPVSPSRNLFKSSTEQLLEALNADGDNIASSPTHKENLQDCALVEQQADIAPSSETVIQEAELEAQRIIQEAHQSSDGILLKAKSEEDSILAQAHSEAQEILDKANKDQEEIKNQAVQEGKQEGYEQAEGEVKRLVNLLQKVSVQMVDEKSKILDTIESDIVDLILMISSKVVKSITTQYKQVVYDNVVAAIGKLKLHNQLVIKVNPEDLYTMEQYKTNLLQEINSIENIQFLEDPTIEQGGCIVKSDFGAIDGRISSQLAEIEEQIRKISPMKPL